MRRKPYSSLIAVSLSLLLLFSCRKEPAATTPQPDTRTPVSLRDIPFAAQAELDYWQGDAHIIYYRTARILAMMELGYNDNELSERPVLLYDFDTTPRYYEFILIGNDGTPSGTVCTYARKEQPAIVAFILPYLREYRTPAVKSSEVNTYALHYPVQLYYGLSTRSGHAPAALHHADGSFEQELPPVQHLQDPIAQISLLGEDYFSALGIEDMPAYKAAAAAALQAEKQAAAAYWEQAALLEDELIAQEQAGWIQTKSATTYIHESVLPQYDTEAMQHTRWTGGCGPSAIANMYRGLYDSYKGAYLPLWGDEEFDSVPGRIYDGRSCAVYFYKDTNGDDDGDGIVNMVDRDWVESHSALTDNGLYADICDYNWYYYASRLPLMPTWGAAFPLNLTRAVERITCGEYTMGVLPTLSAHRHIRTRKLSVILLHSNFSHYVHAYGSREQYWKWETVCTLLGKEVHVGLPAIVTHRWFKINDSGTDMGAHDMLPFWTNDCITNFIFHFGVYRKK